MIIDSIDDLQEQSLEMKGHLSRKRKVDDEVEESPKRRRLDSNEDSGVIEISWFWSRVGSLVKEMENNNADSQNFAWTFFYFHKL